MKILSIITCGIFSIFLTQTHASGGFYLGAKLGGNLLRAKNNYSVATSVFSGSGSTNITKIGFPYALCGGYASAFGAANVVLGAELAVGSVVGTKLSTLNINSTDVGTLKFSQKFGLTFAGIIGKAMNPMFMFYGLLGVDYATFHLQYVSTIPAFPGVLASTRRSATTFFPGMGVKFTFAGHYAVGAEYQFLGMYKKLVVQDSQFYSSVRPVSHRLYLTLSYIF